MKPSDASIHKIIGAADAMATLLTEIAIGLAVGRGGPYPIGRVLQAYRDALGDALGKNKPSTPKEASHV